MLQNNKAFTLIEILFAASILFLSLSFIIPSFVLIHNERQNLYTELTIVKQLERDLHEASLDVDRIPYQTFKQIDHTHVTYTFTTHDQTIRGCATWETSKQQEMSTCLYEKE